MEGKTAKPATIDDYIAGFPEATQAMLRRLRREIVALAPGCSERISYGMPTFERGGRTLHFAAYARHIGLYPAPVGVEGFKADLAGYKTGRGSIQFPLDRELPWELVRRMVRHRLEGQGEASAAPEAGRAGGKAGRGPSPAGGGSPAAATVDGYISAFAAEVGAILGKLRATIREAAPGATERMSYGMPAYELEGPLVYFAGFAKHIGFYPTPGGIEAFKAELAPYGTAKGSVRFPLDGEIPYELVRKITERRVADNLAVAAAKAAARAAAKAKPPAKAARKTKRA